MPTLHRTIVRPIVTEKSSAAFQDRGEYTFEVHPEANKPAIKQAIESLFGVHVTGVWTSQQRGKTAPRRRQGRAPSALEKGDRDAAAKATRSRSSRAA